MLFAVQQNYIHVSDIQPMFKYTVIVRDGDNICDLFETNSWTTACDFAKKQGPKLNGKSVKIEENY